MRGASWARHLGGAVVLLFALGVASTALGADPPAAPSANAATPAAAPKSAPAGGLHLFRGHARRPIFLGLLAAAFLLIGALAGANDRPGGDPPRT